MTVTTLRPDATSAAGSFTAVGAASLNAATSDNSDASYAQGSGTLNSPMVLGLGTTVLSASQRVKLLQARLRFNSSNSGAVGASLAAVSGGGLQLPFPYSTFLAGSVGATTQASGWFTPSSEVTNVNIAAVALQVAQTFTETSSLLRVYELYLDLDVRTRPVVNSLSVSVLLGVPTYNLTFTYGTSGLLETVTADVTVIDENGAIVSHFSQQVTGTDFSAQAVAIPQGSVLPNGTYTVQAFISAGGFVAPDTTFVSAVSTATFTVTPSGVAPPDLVCETDQAAQEVCLTITQPPDELPPATACLRMETFGTGAFGNQATFAGSGNVRTIDKAQLDLVGNITIVAWVRATDWTPASVQVILAKTNQGAGDGGYSLNVQTSGLLNFVISTGAAVRTMVSTAPALTDGQGYWLEVFYDNTAKTARFRKSSDPLLTDPATISWTTINTTAAHAGGSPSANTSDLYIGQLPNGTLGFIGGIGYVQVTGSATPVARTDFRAQPVGATAFGDGLGNSWAYLTAATAINAATVTTVGQPRHAAVWLSNQLVTVDMMFGATSVTITGDTSTIVSTAAGRLCVATTGGGATNVVLVAYQMNAAGTLVHGLNSVNLIVQARQGTTTLQAELGFVTTNANTLEVTGPFTELVSVLILAPSAVPVCVPTISGAIAATTQNQTVVHQFSSLLTLTTFVRTSDNRVSWVGVELISGAVVVDNDGGAGTIHISGYLAVFDDPDGVRVEVQRDGQLIPLDGLNGALVPAPLDGALVVCDRFPNRYSITCEGDSDPIGPTYRVRFYGLVDGILAYSPWSECTPPAVIHNGQALLRHPLDEDLDVSGCVSSEDWNRVRPVGVSQPVEGGMPVVRNGASGGRNYVLRFEAPTTPETIAVETLLADTTYFWYGPVNVDLPSAWLTSADGTVQLTGAPVRERPYTITHATVEIDPEPVLLPPAGPPSS